MKIAIEGHDGVGKTTLARALSQKLRFKYIKHQASNIFGINENEFVEMIKKVILNGDTKLIAWFLAFNDACALNSSENIIIDRHSLLNYHWNGNENTEEIFALSLKLFGKPDLTILLTASDKERIKRLTKRNPDDPDLKHNTRAEDNHKLVKYLEKYQYEYIVFSTNNLTEKEVESKILKLLTSYL